MQWPKQRQSSQQVHQERAPDSHVKPKPRLCCQHWKDEDKSFAEAPAKSYTSNAIIHKLVLCMNDSVVGNLSSCAATDVQISLVPLAVIGAQRDVSSGKPKSLIGLHSKDNSVLWKACQDSNPHISYITHKLEKTLLTWTNEDGGATKKRSIQKWREHASIPVNTNNKKPHFFKLKIVAIKLPIMSGLLHICLKNRYFS